MYSVICPIYRLHNLNQKFVEFFIQVFVCFFFFLRGTNYLTNPRLGNHLVSSLVLVIDFIYIFFCFIALFLCFIITSFILSKSLKNISGIFHSVYFDHKKTEQT